MDNLGRRQGMCYGGLVGITPRRSPQPARSDPSERAVFMAHARWGLTAPRERSYKRRRPREVNPRADSSDPNAADRQARPLYGPKRLSGQPYRPLTVPIATAADPCARGRHSSTQHFAP